MELTKSIYKCTKSEASTLVRKSNLDITTEVSEGTTIFYQKNDPFDTVATFKNGVLEIYENGNTPN